MTVEGDTWKPPIKWKIRAAHWNTGRLYIARDFEYDIYSFGGGKIPKIVCPCYLLKCKVWSKFIKNALFI